MLGEHKKDLKWDGFSEIMLCTYIQYKIKLNRDLKFLGSRNWVF